MPKEEVWKLIGKVLDAIRDAGGTGGRFAGRHANGRCMDGHMQSGTTVKFVLSDLKPLREQSYEQAVADARARGDRLAKLSGIKLAAVAAVQETQVAGRFARSESQPLLFWGWNETTTTPSTSATRSWSTRWRRFR